MAIRHDDGEFSVDCWEDPERDDVEAVTDYADTMPEARAHALTLLAAGRFRWIEISRWNPPKQDWDLIEELTPEDL